MKVKCDKNPKECEDANDWFGKCEHDRGGICAYKSAISSLDNIVVKIDKVLEAQKEGADK